MNHRAETQHATLVTALSLAGFEVSVETPLRTSRELAKACRELDAAFAKEGVRMPANRIAENCAEVLEILAARFRRVAEQLQVKPRTRK